MKKIKKLFTLLLCLLTITTPLIGISATTTSAVSYTISNINLNGSWVSDSISNIDQEDYFKFTLASDGEVTITVMSYASITYDLFNNDMSEFSNNNYVVSGTSSSPSTKAHTFILSKGSYYLKVYNYSSENIGRYKIKGTFVNYGCTEKEPNDYDSAMTLVPNSTVTSCITDSNFSDDWYKLIVPTKSKITIKFINYGSAALRLYNNDLSICHIDWLDTMFSSGTLQSPKNNKYNQHLKKGIYYIKIYSGKGKYKLSWSYTVKPEVPEDLYITKRTMDQITMDWSKDESQCYQIQKKYRGKWTIIGTTKKYRFTAKKLKRDTTYKFRIRGCNTYKGKKYYGKWCPAVTAKTW